MRRRAAACRCRLRSRFVLHRRHRAAGCVQFRWHMVPHTERRGIGHAVQRGVLWRCEWRAILHGRYLRGRLHLRAGRVLRRGKHILSWRRMPCRVILYRWLRSPYRVFYGG